MAIDLGPQHSRDIGADQSTGSSISVLTEIITDSITFSDTISVGINIPGQSYTETLVLTDAGLLIGIGLLINENLIFNDSIMSANPLAYSFNEQFQPSDALGLLLDPNLKFSFTDTFSPTDGITLLLSPVPIPLTLFDTYTLSDSLRLFTQVGKNQFTEILTISDSIKLFSAPRLSLNDVLLLNDRITLESDVNGFTLHELISCSDAVQLQLSSQLNLILNESINFVDEASITPSTSFSSYLRRYLNDVPGDMNNG